MDRSITIAGRSDPDDTDWFERSEFWRTFKPKRRGPGRKYKFREPLILCGHGIRLCVDHGTLLIRTGFTHYPQKSEEIRFFPGDGNLPDRIIILDGSGGISFDALNWMSEQKIEFVRLDWQGRATSVGGNSGYAADPKLANAQRSVVGTRRQIEIARWLISEKIEASISTLANSIPRSEIRDNAINILRTAASDLRKANSISKLLGIEGKYAKVYFQPWHGLPLHWSRTKRTPIPADWSEIVPRTMGWRTRAQAARHPINAMLNYGYGILAHQIRTNTIAAGLDPTIGVLHHNKRNPIPLVYDLMEPLRPMVDQAILEFGLANTFTSADFTITKWGGCRLNPQMTKPIVGRLASSISSGEVVRKTREYLTH